MSYLAMASLRMQQQQYGRSMTLNDENDVERVMSTKKTAELGHGRGVLGSINTNTNTKSNGQPMMKVKKTFANANKSGQSTTSTTTTSSSSSIQKTRMAFGDITNASSSGKNNMSASTQRSKGGGGVGGNDTMMRKKRTLKTGTMGDYGVNNDDLLLGSSDIEYMPPGSSARDMPYTDSLGSTLADSLARVKIDGYGDLSLLGKLPSEQYGQDMLENDTKWRPESLEWGEVGEELELNDDLDLNLDLNLPELAIDFSGL